MWTGSKPLLSKWRRRICYNHVESFTFRTLGKEKTLWMICFEIHEEKYCMALNIGSYQSTVWTKKQKQESVLKQDDYVFVQYKCL